MIRQIQCVDSFTFVTFRKTRLMLRPIFFVKEYSYYNKSAEHTKPSMTFSIKKKLCQTKPKTVDKYYENAEMIHLMFQPIMLQNLNERRAERTKKKSIKNKTIPNSEIRCKEKCAQEASQPKKYDEDEVEK